MDFLLKIKHVVSTLGGHEAQVPGERRDTPRIVVPIEGTCRTQDGTEMAAVISDVGLYGLRLEVPRPLVAGLSIDVCARRDIGLLALAQFEHDTIRTEVLWCKRSGSHFIAGVRYDDRRSILNTSWVAFIFQKFGINVGSSTQRRKDVRIQSRVPVLVTDESGQAVQAEAVNMGVGGLLLASGSVFPEQARVRLKIGPYRRLATLELEGVVVRRKLSRKSDTWLLGVAFFSASHEASALLTRYLLQVLRDADTIEPARALL